MKSETTSEGCVSAWSVVLLDPTARGVERGGAPLAAAADAVLQAPRWGDGPLVIRFHPSRLHSAPFVTHNQFQRNAKPTLNLYSLF